MDENAKNVFSEKIKAGKKTYFFDIKSTRTGNSYYLLVTESRKIYHEDGSYSFYKSKLLIYPEDIKRVLKMMQKMNPSLLRQRV